MEEISHKRQRIFLGLGALNGFLAVSLGAFGAHGLEKLVDADRQQAFITAVQYHAWHALAIIAAGLAMHWINNRWLPLASWLFLAGILLFSGSIYTLVLGGPGWLGPITPIGGTCLLAGWAMLTLGFMTAKPR